MNINQQSEKEKQLLSKVSAGDDSGFWELWKQHRPVLYIKCRRMMNGNTDDTEDVLSTAMLHAREKLARYAAQVTNFKSWVLKLTENLCIDQIRKRKKIVRFDDRLPGDIVNDEEMAGHENGCDTAEELHQREEMMQAVYNQMRKLPPRLREPAILRFFMLMPHRDIALRLHITEETARKRIQQAREQLNGRLKDIVAILSHWKTNGNSNGNGCHSPVWIAIQEEAHRVMEQSAPEITFNFSATRVIRISMPSGHEKAIPIFLSSNTLQQKIKVKTLEEYIARYPSGWRKRLQLAEILYANGNWEQAIKHFSQVVDKHPQSLSARLLLGQMFINTQQEEKAVAVYQSALQFVRNQSTKFFLSGMIEWCCLEMEGAAIAFKKATELEPWNEIFLRAQALTHLKTNQLNKALNAFEAALAINPNDIVSLTHGYELLVEHGCLDRAEEFVKRILQTSPTDILALKRQVKIRCRQGLVQGEEGKITRNLIRRLKQLSPNFPMFYEADTVYHYYRGEWSKALDPLKATVNDMNKSCDGCHAYSLWLFRTGDYQEAARYISKRCQWVKENIGMSQSSPASHLLACDIMAALDEPMGLKKVIEEMLELFPGHWQVLAKVGLLLATHLEEFAPAFEIFKKAITSQPHLPGIYFDYAQALIAGQDYQQAQDIIEQGWRFLPANQFCAHACTGASLMVQCYRETGQSGKEKPWVNILLDSARQLQRQRPARGYYFEAQALEASGNPGAAMQAYREALDFQLPYPARQEVKNILKTTGMGK